jgi:hypothetical protein
VWVFGGILTAISRVRYGPVFIPAGVPYADDNAGFYFLPLTIHGILCG